MYAKTLDDKLPRDVLMEEKGRRVARIVISQRNQIKSL